MLIYPQIPNFSIKIKKKLNKINNIRKLAKNPISHKPYKTPLKNSKQNVYDFKRLQKNLKFPFKNWWGTNYRSAKLQLEYFGIDL